MRLLKVRVERGRRTAVTVARTGTGPTDLGGSQVPTSVASTAPPAQDRYRMCFSQPTIEWLMPLLGSSIFASAQEINRSGSTSGVPKAPMGDLRVQWITLWRRRRQPP